jgi:hypothetical protein
MSTHIDDGPKIKGEDRPFALEELYTTERGSSLH